MPNFLKPDKLAMLQDALADGCGVRTAARIAGCSHITAMRYLRLGLLRRGPCGCGKQAGHNGWCSWRFRRSHRRRAFIASWASGNRRRTSHGPRQTPSMSPEQIGMVEAHIELVHKIASTLLRGYTDIERDDLISAGYVGLLEAATTFDPTRGASFKTHAGNRIQGAMLDERRKQAHSRGFVRVHHPEANALRWRRKIAFEPIPVDEDGVEIDIIAPPSASEEQVDRERVERLLSLPLDWRSRTILNCKIVGLNQKTIADRLNVSEGRISQLWDRLESRLCEMVQAVGVEPTSPGLKDRSSDVSA